MCPLHSASSLACGLRPDLDSQRDGSGHSLYYLVLQTPTLKIRPVLYSFIQDNKFLSSTMIFFLLLLSLHLSPLTLKSDINKTC